MRRQGDDEGAAARAKLVGAPFFVLPDYLENWALMTKKEFLAIREIYQYQEMTAAEISAVFFQLGVQRGANLFYLMLQSFKITHRVATAGWRLFQAVKSVVKPHEHVWIPPSIMDEVGAALSDFSPENFPEFRVINHLEFAQRCFEQFYNEASTKTTKEEVEELIFEWGKRLQEQIDAKNVDYEKPTVEQVVVATKRTPVTSE